MADSPLQLDFKAPWSSQLAFFRQKLNLPTEAFDDILKEAHDRAFIVAGAAKADLLNELRQAVDKSIAEGKSIGWFSKQFDEIVQTHGWDYVGERNWRTRIIYQTNLQTSYAAGRYQQLTDPELLQARPYWVYHHGHPITPRLEHKGWDGMALPASDPWWQSHYTPNGYGCTCWVSASNKEEIARKGWRLLDSAPDDGTYDYTVPSTGELVTLPRGVDYGWDYAPGASYTEKLMKIQEGKLENYPWQLAKANIADLVNAPLFANFFKGGLEGEFPIAALPPSDMALLDAQSPVVLLSQESLAAHVAKHPEITLADYRKAQTILEQGDVYLLGELKLIYLYEDGMWYRAALKRTQDGSKNYFLTLFKNTRGKPPDGAVKVER